jgi:Tfp pilus assembly protein PilX
MKRLRLLGREEGIALVMALGILMVLSITLTSIIYYTSSSSRDASRNHAAQKSYALAEAALNNGADQIAAHYPSQKAVDTAWQTPGCPAATPAPLLCGGPVSYLGGTATWSSWYTSTSSTTGTWTIKATGSVANPTGPTAAAITRTINGSIDVSFDPKAAPVWQWVYSGATNALGLCDMTLDQSTSFYAPIYVVGNLCLQNGAKIEQQAGATGDRLVVGGYLDQQSTQNEVGNSTSRLTGVRLVGACKYKSNGSSGPPCSVNNSTYKVWTQSLATSLPTPPLPDPTMTAADWQDRYTIASPGPMHDCTSWTGTKPVFDNNSVLDDSLLLPFSLVPSGSTYSCTTPTGSISWNGSKLTVSGTIFIDGNIQITTPNGSPAQYVGVGNIFASGTISFQNNSGLCAKLSGSNCDTVYGDWDPRTAMLILAAYNKKGLPLSDSIVVSQSQFQGGLYGQTSINVGQSSSVQGPMVSPATIKPGQSGTATFPQAQDLAPGYPLDPYSIGPLYGHTG